MEDTDNNISKVTITLEEEVKTVSIDFTFHTYGLNFCDYLDACRKTALAFGFSENLVREYFED